MAYQYRIDAARRLAVVTFSGPLDGRDMAEGTERLYHDPAWGYGFDTVCDFREVRGVHLDVGHLPAILALERRLAPLGGPGADALVTATDFHHMLARLYAHLSRKGPRPALACRSMPEAFEALARRRAEQAASRLPRPGVPS